MIKSFLPIIAMMLLLLSSDLSAQKAATEQNAIGVENGMSGRYTEAITNFNKSIELYDAEAAKTIHNMGWLYELQGDQTNALAFYEEALKRSPDLVHTLERAGYLQFLKGDYEKAIIHGERALKLDPVNKEVIKWLPDAYALRFKVKGDVIDKIVKEEKAVEAAKVAEQLKKEDKQKRRWITASYEGTARMSYLRAAGSGFDYTPTKGYGLNIPNMFRLDITPFESWEVRAQTGIPYYGALADDLISWNERVEGFFFKDLYFLGMGVMGNHYNSGTKRYDDYKLGIVFGKYGDKSRFDVVFYPRMFPADAGTSKHETLDVDMLEINYAFIPPGLVKYTARGTFNDFYFFDNQNSLSYYTGVYAFAAGVAYNDRPGSLWLVKGELIERVYLQNFGNKRPYAMFNGQGLMGLDRYNWFKGDPLSGINTMSTGFTVTFEERPIPNFFTYQTVGAEFVRKNQRGNDFFFTLGVGGYY